MRKKKIKDIVRTLDGVVCEMDRNTSLYIDNLEEKVFYLNIEKERLELELKEIKPVPEEMWTKVAEYCDNDVIATEAVFNHLKGDFTPKEEDTK